jgi:hypothetical protein
MDQATLENPVFSRPESQRGAMPALGGHPQLSVDGDSEKGIALDTKSACWGLSAQKGRANLST